MSERTEKICTKCEFACCKIRTSRQGDQKCCKNGKSDCCQVKACCEDGSRGEDETSCCKNGKSDCFQEEACCKDLKCVERKFCEDGKGTLYCKCECICKIKASRVEDEPSCFKAGKSERCQEKSCCEEVKCVERKFCEDGKGNFNCKCECTCEIKASREEDEPSCFKAGKSDCCQEKACCKEVKCVERKFCEDGKGNFYCKCECICKTEVRRGEDKPSCSKAGKSDCCQEKTKGVKCVERKFCEDGKGNFYCKCERTCEIKVNRGADEPSFSKAGKSECCQEKACCKEVKCVERKFCEDGKGNYNCKCECTCEIKLNREEDKPSCCKAGKSYCSQEKTCSKEVKCVERKFCEDGKGNFNCKCECTCEIKVSRGEDEPSCSKAGESNCCQEKTCCKEVKCVERKFCEDGNGNFYCKCECICKTEVRRGENKPSCSKAGKSERCQGKACCKNKVSCREDKSFCCKDGGTACCPDESCCKDGKFNCC